MKLRNWLELALLHVAIILIFLFLYESTFKSFVINGLMFYVLALFYIIVIRPNEYESENGIEKKEN